MNREKHEDVVDSHVQTCRGANALIAMRYENESRVGDMAILLNLIFASFVLPFSFCFESQLDDVQ